MPEVTHLSDGRGALELDGITQSPRAHVLTDSTAKNLNRELECIQYTICKSDILIFICLIPL